MVDQVRVVAGALEAFTGRQVQRLGLNVTANLIEDTPRVTGWARANWVPIIDGLFEGDGTPPKPGAPGTQVNARRAEQQQGVATVATANPARFYREPITVTNNVPYIGRLNDGSSIQAPRGFIQLDILRALQQLEGEEVLGL